jgi:acyl-CoA synthetase (AMP-forming)/AMP-acid ligase II
MSGGNAEAGAPGSDAPSIVAGIALQEEPGLGALTIPGYLREVTTRYAGREAVVHRSAHGALRWTYATLWERSVEVARALVASGLGKDGRVGILMTNRPEYLAAAFGTALAGGVVVALSTFSTPTELEHLLGVSSVSVLLFERRVAARDFLAVLHELEPAARTAEPGRLLSTRLPFLRRLVVVDGAPEHDAAGAVETWPDFLRRGSATPETLVAARAAAVAPADAGALFFSSGTTSAPKGVLHAQRAAAIQWWRWSRLLRAGDPARSWTANGFFWSGNFSMVIGSTLSAGGTLVLQSTFEAEVALELLQRERVSLAFAWPHQWAKLEATAGWGTADLGSLRHVDADSPAERHPTVRADRLPLAYGTTETLTIAAAFPAATPLEITGGSHGEALPGNTLKIVDPATGAVLPRGERGEIAVKGPTLMRGYLGIPADETLDAEGFFHTGDAGLLDAAGRLYWEGRLTQIIKTGGANVSPREIDGVLAACPGVRLTQTVGVAHETLGEMVVSCIVPQEGVELDETAIRRFARERLASYKVPRRVLFFRDDELSMTGSEKVDADALRRLVAGRLRASFTSRARASRRG